MRTVRHEILVLSGKGGVGKSTVSVNLAAALADSGRRVGLLDVDVHGPSVPKLLGLEGRAIGVAEGGLMLPVEAAGLRVMSVGFLLQDAADAVIWRGPMKHTVIRQLLGETAWGELDYLVIDAPPGTGDEPLSVCQLLPDADGAVVVTTPQDASTANVRRSITFCRQLNTRVLGVVENMSGFVCPRCGGRVDIFKVGGGRRLAEEAGAPFLGAVPLDAAVVESADSGSPFVRRLPGSAATKSFEAVVASLLATIEAVAAPLARVQPGSREAVAEGSSGKGKDGPMRIAIPLAEGKLSQHFGHCEMFALVDVAEGKVSSREDVPAPEHQPGLLPRWLASKGANVIIAGGMGARAQGLFAEHGIKVLVGAPSDEPERLVEAYLAGTLVTGENVCDH